MPALAASDFELLFGALPTPCAVLAADGRVQALNKALAALVPEAAALPGQSFAVLHAGMLAAGSVLPRLEQCQAALAAANTSVQQVLLPTTESTVAPASRYWQLTLQPVYASEAAGAELRYLLLQLLDVSEQVAEAGVEVQEPLPSLADDLPLLLWTTNAEGLVNYANQSWCEQTGLTPMQTYGRGWLAAVHPHEREQVAAQWQHSLANGESWESTFRLCQGRTGQYRWYLARAQPQRDADGRIQQWQASFTDIHSQRTDARQRRRRQRQASRLLAQLDQLPLYLVLMRGPAHEISYVSGKACAYLPANATGRPAATLEPGLDPAIIAAFDEVYLSGQPQHLGPLPATPHHAPAGAAPHYLDVTAMPLRAPDGSIEGVLMTGIDVTDRMAVEQQMAAMTAETQRQLAAKEAKRRRILDQLPSYIATYEGDDLRLTYLSPNHDQLLGGPRAQLGQTLREAAPELAEQGLEALMREVYETGRPHLAFEQELEFLVPATGQRQQRFLNFGYYPLTDDAGQSTGILAFAHDVTSQVLAHRHAEALQAEARAADQRLRLMTESLPLISYISRADAAVTEYLSPQWFEYTGTNPSSESFGTEWARAIHPDELAEVVASFQLAMRERQPWTQELRLRRHDGQYRWHLTRSVPEIDAATGELLRWYGSTTDVHELREARHQLEAKDQQLSQILSQAPALIATMEGPEHRYAFTNPGYDALVSHRARLGRPVAECLPELVEQGFIELLDKVYRTGEPYSGREVALDLIDPATQQRQEAYVDFSYQPLRSNAGAITGVLVFAVDVTKQVLARQQAEQLQTDFRFLAESIPQMVWTLDANGRLSFVNQRWIEYTGQDLAQTQQGGWSEIMAPEDRAKVRNRFLAHLAAGQPYSEESRMRQHSDGQYRWFLHRAVPLHNEQGQVVRWFGTSTDVHEQHELQERLRESEAQFRFLAESVPQILWTARPDGWVDYYNQHWFNFTGLDMEQSAGAGRELILHPDDLPSYFEHWNESLRTGKRYQVEYRFRRHDGQYRWYLGRAEAMRDDAGNIVKWIGTCTDIHEHKLAQQRLEEQNAALMRTNQDLDNFVYTASHDLKQPINNMAGIFEELTRTAYFRDPDAIKLIVYFERALKQIYDTIEDLSAIVQVQRQQGEVAATDVPLAPLTTEIINSVHDQVTQLNATFELDFDTFPTLHFVRPNLQSVLYNLISNSLKYAAPDRPPHIRVACRPDAVTGRPVLMVQDNGLGIDMVRYGPQLFQLFRRFHTHVEGSGMGLYLVNRIVQNHGGRLEVDSTVGQGTTFRLFL